MTILESYKIDIVAEHPSGDRVRLVIVDDLCWQSADRYACALQEKVNTYLAFIESGQILQTAHTARHGAEIEFQIVMRHYPDPNILEVVAKVGEFLRGEGYRFAAEVKAPGQPRITVA